MKDEKITLSFYLVNEMSPKNKIAKALKLFLNLKQKSSSFWNQWSTKYLLKMSQVQL